MKQFYKILALLMATFLLLSLTILPAFADDGETDATDPETTEATGSDDTETTGAGDTETTGAGDTETTGAGDTETTGEDGATGEAEAPIAGDTAETTDTTGETTEAPVTTTGSDDTAESTGLSTTAIVWIVVGGVIVVAGVVLGIIFREKVGKFFRVYKSEIKKIVWLPWNQTCKSTLVVLVILVICAAAICLVDLGLSKGFLAFLKLFKK